ncbi:hypothetical protein [Natrinema sp. SYSU A 869]
MRNLLWIVDRFPFATLLGMALILFADENQRVGDFIANTIVGKQR